MYQWSSASTTSCFNFKIPPSLLNKLTILETVWVRNMGDEREYSLAILVILLLLCWPAAIVYYYTRPKKPQFYPPPGGPRVLPSLRRSNNPRQHLLSELWETSGLKAGAKARPFAAEPRRGIRSHAPSTDLRQFLGTIGSSNHIVCNQWAPLDD